MGSSFLSILGYGVLMWGYPFFGRVHAMSPVDIGIRLGLIVGIGGSLGAYVGGALVDRFDLDPVALCLTHRAASDGDVF